MWHDLLGAALALIVVCWVASFTVKKWTPRVASALQVAAGIVSRIAVGCVFVAIAAGTAGRGGYWLLLTAPFCLLALFSFALVGLTVFVLVREPTHSRRHQAS